MIGTCCNLRASFYIGRAIIFLDERDNVDERKSFAEKLEHRYGIKKKKLAKIII